MAELEVGTLVAGKYRVKRRIGAGGMGAVYEGEHVEIGKRVAIKVIEHEHAKSSELAARFKREARAASAVESDHIVHVFDVGQDDNVGLYMVMEYLAGEDLAARLEKTGGKLPVDEAVTIVLQAARALAKAHGAGVVHRDLKPANLFLTSREDESVHVKVLDFGISKLARPDGKSGTTTGNLTREGSVMGTPMYMSPEQAQGMAVDARTDVWSLGAVAYEALAGRTAFDPRDTYEQMIIQIVTQKPKPLRDVAPWVPEPIARVVESALVHEAAARPQDMSTFAKQLAAAAKMPSAPTSTRDATLVDDGTQSQPRIEVRVNTGERPPTGTGVVVGARTQLDAGIPPKRPPLVWIAAAAVALVATIGIAAVATRDKAPVKDANAGLVAPAPRPSEAPPATTTVPPPTMLPLETASAPAPSASASAKPALAGKPTPPRPTATTAATTTKPAAASTQYGAAGVSTAY
ncbi:MAG TPA: serine/threonine-protein kinase [Labilithrix sp.]